MAICNECVNYCVTTIRESQQQKPEAKPAKPTEAHTAKAKKPKAKAAGKGKKKGKKPKEAE